MTLPIRSLYERAIGAYGFREQLIKAVEELGELTQAMAKQLLEPSDANRSHVAEEIADVRIMLEQAEMILDIRAEATRWKYDKLKRLKERLDQSQ